MAFYRSTHLLADNSATSIVLVNQAHGTSTAVVNPINTEEGRVDNCKLMFPTPTLGSKPDSYCANIHYNTVSTLNTEVRGISYQSHLFMLAQVMNQQLVADIKIDHWLQSYEEQLVDPFKVTIIGFYRGNSTDINTTTVAVKTQLLCPTDNATTHIACTLCRPQNIKFVSVKVAMDFEDLAKAPCECTFQKIVQLPIGTI